MARNRGPARALGILGCALLILSGCDRLAHNDTEWARAALERNPNLTIVAADKDANTFTVQVKGSSELRVIHANEVIGSLPSTGIAPAVGEPSETAKASPPSESAPAGATTESSKETPTNETASAGEPARPANETGNRSAQASPGLKSGSGFITDSSGKTRTFGGAEAPTQRQLRRTTRNPPLRGKCWRRVLATPSRQARPARMERPSGSRKRRSSSHLRARRWSGATTR